MSESFNYSVTRGAKKREKKKKNRDKKKEKKKKNKYSLTCYICYII